MKSINLKIDGIWKSVSLTDEEEKQIKEKAKNEHKELMKECLKEAGELTKGSSWNEVAQAIIATAIFEKQSTHTVFYIEEALKQKYAKR